MCFKQVHVFNMFVLKGKSRLITDKNIFALCFKEYLKKKKKRSKSRYDRLVQATVRISHRFPKKERIVCICRGLCRYVLFGMQR